MIRKLNAAFREAGMAYKLVDYGPLSLEPAEEEFGFSTNEDTMVEVLGHVDTASMNVRLDERRAGLAPCGQLTVTEKLRPGAASDCGRPQGPPGPCHFNKEQTPLGDLLDPNPRFHGGCFGV